MSTGLTKADIEAAVDAARGRKGPQIELRDLRFRAGERSAKWSLMVGLHTGERSRITLGSWPALSINDARAAAREVRRKRSEEHTSELQSLMRISYAVFCWKKKNKKHR